MKNKDKFKPNAVYTIEQPKGNLLSEVSFYLRIVLFLCTDLFNTASSATPQIQLSQRMLGSNSGRFRILPLASQTLQPLGQISISNISDISHVLDTEFFTDLYLTPGTKECSTSSLKFAKLSCKRIGKQCSKGSKDQHACHLGKYQVFIFLEKD